MARVTKQQQIEGIQQRVKMLEEELKAKYENGTINIDRRGSNIEINLPSDMVGHVLVNGQECGHKPKGDTWSIPMGKPIDEMADMCKGFLAWYDKGCPQ